MTDTINESVLYVDRYGLMQWMAVHKPSNRCAVGESELECVELFRKTHDQDLPLYRVVRGRPPFPKRPENAPQEDKLLGAEADSRFRRALLSAFHDDHHHGHRKTFSCDEIVATINRIWSEGAK